MRIYISGPMRSQPDMGRSAFGRAAAALRGQGHQVYVPTEQPGALDAREGDAVRAALADNLAWVCVHAEGVVVLPRWRDSRGTKAEVATALALDIPVWAFEAFVVAGEKAVRVRSTGGAMFL